MMKGHLDLLAQRIATCREEEGLTLLELSERSGVAPSTIQKVEKGQMVPTIAVLVKIANGLRRRVSFLIGDEDRDLEVSHRSARKRPAVQARNRVRAERLAGDIREPEFDAYELFVPPGAGSGADPLRHRGDELIVCTHGKVLFRIGRESFELQAGDSLHFKSILPHSWKNVGKRTARMIIIGSFPRAFQSAEIAGRKSSASAA